MRGYEIREQLASDLRPEHRFVRWWRNENDFLDYDLLDRFRNRLTGEEEIDGVELLTRTEMWQELERVTGKRVSVQHLSSHGRGETVIEWQHTDKAGTRTEQLPDTEETLINIYDAETRDNPIC